MAELPKVTDLTDLLHRLLTSDRPGGLLTERQMLWKSHLGNSKDNYRAWIESALAEFQHDLQQQSQLRKCYRARLHDHQLAEIELELESVQTINSVGESIDACLVFINEVKIIDP